ncbi:hypothetical protein BD626DRAFT_446515 [Schizophyllum amplum]|uniref:F-box domain-containing protein n=1 Tax=Schizophyllum amplum TaxID=97359 RepID=A0A550CVV8_9AGAR|nr:hypothetical protein BD626DRAFT_446515 [Auriculariopsis ampla]
MHQPVAASGLALRRDSPVRFSTGGDQARSDGRPEYVFLSVDTIDDVPAEYRHLRVISTTRRGIVLGPRGVSCAPDGFGGSAPAPARALPAPLAEVSHRSVQSVSVPTTPIRDRRDPCYIQRLPTELLCAIFLMCGESNPRFIYPRDRHMHHIKTKARLRTYNRAAVMLGRVCSRWLMTTQGCPTLWTMFDVFYPRPGDIAGLQLCLKYSAGLPLSLQVEEGPVVALRRPDLCRRMMQMVADNAPRWQEMSLYLHNASDILDPLLVLPPGSFSCLTRASLCLWKMNRNQARRDGPLWNLLYASRSLRTVEWWDDPYHPLHTTTPAVHHLTHISAHSISPDHLINILQVCLQLEVLQAGVESTEFVFPGAPDAHLLPVVGDILLPRLRILMLSGMRDWSRLYRVLTVPALDRLDLCAAGVQARYMEDMLTRSTARLTMLTMHWPQPGYGDETSALLQSSPLRQLKILRYTKDDSPDNESDDYDPRPCLPAALCVFTVSFQHAEVAYRDLQACQCRFPCLFSVHW